MTAISRRAVMIGMGAALTVSAANRALSTPVPVPRPEKLYRGIKYQTWPMEAMRPEHDYWFGSVRGDERKPQSYWMKYIDRFKGLPGSESLKWEMIE